MHHLLIAHAKAVDLYWKQYKAKQNGIIGITMQAAWAVPKYYTPEASLAAYRSIEFVAGWVVHPITYGDYPQIMRSLVGCRLPKFTEEESKLLTGSLDFLGVNYYSARYAEDANISCVIKQGPTNDARVNLTATKNGIPIGPQVADSWMYVYPQGLEYLISYLKENYNSPPMYITENGVQDPADYDDTIRIDYHRSHLQHVLQAMKYGADVRGYYVWTFLDDFEWSSGFTLKFGLYDVDRTNMKRTPKASVHWFKKFLNTPKPKILDSKEMQSSSLLSTA
ncbi:hypothetical protein TIFTF001_044700 [Ficus carica]|uniref:Beta-glucosidase n=1 Tax=Ficus carica TaxID=3494 RepID=A0AA88CW11_FICCA|nr:hypothetical protein TIFTF001_044699 [Ficus carica]GMN32591.1 hypothetical protein TIFTF001_044700 [Ficus carica]